VPKRYRTGLNGFGTRKLWANGHSLDIDAYANQIDPDKWSDFNILHLRDGGRLYGTAINVETGKEHAVLLLKVELVPDWDRDGVIDQADAGKVFPDKPWVFWVNDDNDDGIEAGSATGDLPENGIDPDYANENVDGLRDVVDFFPIHLDIRGLLQGFDDETLESIRLRLSHADDALNFVYTDLQPDEVGRIHREILPTGFGAIMADDFSAPLAEARTWPITADGTDLSVEFLKKIRDEGKGVLLLEARGKDGGDRSSSEPLVLEIVAGSGTGTRILEWPLRIVPIRKMLRIVNLRQGTGENKLTTDSGPWPTSTTEPSEYPDGYLSPESSPVKTLVHVHGFNWNEDEIPAGHAELFKRFFQAGSNARFIGVSWHSDEGAVGLIGTSIDYNENVIHAFMAAKFMASQLSGFDGDNTSIFAHSLGNMITSGATIDYGLNVGNCFMINAAVPKEAYDGGDGDPNMVHPEWSDYETFLMAPNWHRAIAEVYGPTDRRSLLKWNGRFANIPAGTAFYNFYSPGEDVLAGGDGSVPPLATLSTLWGQPGGVLGKEQVWVYNEMTKGRRDNLGPTLTDDVDGGWGLNREWMTFISGGPHNPPEWRPMRASSASELSPAEIIAEPFFRPFSSHDEEFPAWGDGLWLYGATAAANAQLPNLPFGSAPMDHIMNHAKIIAEAIPAHSDPAGFGALTTFDQSRNINLETMRDAAVWPDEVRETRKRNRWLHGDYGVPAYLYVYRLFETCVELGGLDQ